MLDIASALDLISQGGTFAALLLALVGGMKGWYVWKWTHDSVLKTYQDQLDAMTTDRDYWRKMAMGALTAAGQAVSVAAITTKASVQDDINTR